MRIDSGAMPLSTALLKALGSQAAPAAAATKPAAAPARPAEKVPAAQPDEADAIARSRNMPRGSFVDLRA